MTAHVTEIAELVAEIKTASTAIANGDSAVQKRVDKHEEAINELFKKTSRPGAEWAVDDDATFARKSAVEMCKVRRALNTPKIDAGISDDYTPTSNEIDDALLARKAIKKVFRTGEARLDHLERKSLSAFSFGSNGFLLAPEMSSRVLSCLVDPSDVSGLVDHIQISAGSVRFLIDNVRMAVGAWACQSDCFANNPQPDLQAGLGEMEIKAETLRFVACATSDLLQDASFNVEAWLFRKVSEGFRRVIRTPVSFRSKSASRAYHSAMPGSSCPSMSAIVSLSNPSSRISVPQVWRRP
jgi:HK97 family phage major capsid protein